VYAFTYHRPSSLAEAQSMLQGKDDPTIMAGGQTLIPTLKQRLAQPSDVIDLGAVRDLAGIAVEGDTVHIGAMTRHAAVAASAEVRRVVPALAHLAGLIGDPAVRNMGTIGGSIANADPAADYPAGLVGLGATVHTNRRQVAAEDFFTGMFETALEDGEIVTKVSFPKADRAGYTKFRNPASRYAVVGVFVAQKGDAVRVAVTGAGPSVFRVPEMEQALARDFTADAIADIQVAADDLNSDLHASAEYRAHLVTVMAKRAVRQALGQPET
jgi:carbon-monoxide dehydrogenase medium subunit